MLSLKTAQERPSYKDFADQYTRQMQTISDNQVRLSQISESSQRDKFVEDDISTVLTAHKNALSTEFHSFSSAFEDLLADAMAKDSDDDVKCPFPPDASADLSGASGLLASPHLDNPKPPSANRKIGFHHILRFEWPIGSTRASL